MPAWRGLRTHMWRHSEEFLRKAATLILAAAVIVWVLLNLPMGVQNTEDSLFGRAAGAVAPLFEPLGFGNWQATGSLATGLVAKEVVVSSMAVIYLGDEPAEPPQPVNLAADVRAIVVGFAQAIGDSLRIVLSMIPGVDLMGDEPIQANTGLSQALQAHFTPASALAFLVFVLLYAPCVAAMGALRSEFGAKWMVFSFFYLLALAWIAGFVTYQVAGWLMG
jgi:ferrous iron transport protein B